MKHTTIIILSGIPCSGKSSFVANRIYDYSTQREILSRDELRLHMYGEKYKPTPSREDEITRVFNKLLLDCVNDSEIEEIILNNTHCREKYIDEVIHEYKRKCNIRIKFFNIPLWQAHIKNVGRWLKTGKWIPIYIMNNMARNYRKINKGKYAEYTQDLV